MAILIGSGRVSHRFTVAAGATEIVTASDGGSLSDITIGLNPGALGSALCEYRLDAADGSVQALRFTATTADAVVALTVGGETVMAGMIDEQGREVPGYKALAPAFQAFGNWLTSPPDTSRMPGSTMPRIDNRQRQPTQQLPTPPVAPSPMSPPSPQPDTAQRRRADRGAMTGSAGGLPSNAATPDTAPFSRLSAAANYPNDNTISNLGNYPAATDLVARSGQAIGIGTATDYAAATGGQRLTNAAQGAGGTQSVVAGSSLPVMGNADGRRYQTDYALFGGNGQQGTASIVGPNQRAGNGTLSAPDSGNGGTIEGNVARLNSQIAAIRSQREAQNPGITTGGTGGGLPSAPTMDVFARPGDGWGDSEMRAEQYRGMMNEAGTGRGMTRNQRAAMAAGAQGLIAPGLAQIQQQGQMYGQQLDAYGKQQAANQALQQQDQAYALGQQKNLLDAQKAQQQYGLDAAKAEYQARLQGAQTQEAQARAQGLTNTQQLMNMYQAMYKHNPNDEKALDHIRGLILMSQRRNEPQGDELAQLLASKLPQAGQ